MGLVLTRKPGESFEIDGPAKITVLKTFGCGKVKYHIEADESVKILRSELVEIPEASEELCQSLK